MIIKKVLQIQTKLIRIDILSRLNIFVINRTTIFHFNDLMKKIISTQI